MNTHRAPVNPLAPLRRYQASPDPRISPHQTLKTLSVFLVMLLVTVMLLGPVQPVALADTISPEIGRETQPLNDTQVAIGGSLPQISIAPKKAADNPDMAGVLSSSNLQQMDLVYDYGELSPNIAVYQHDDTKQYYAVISQLPETNPDKTAIATNWILHGSNYESFNNTYDATVTPSGQVTVTFPYHDIGDMQYAPALSSGGKAIIPKGPPSVSLYDYFDNPNYSYNTLVWDYGVCTRILRQIEGQLQGRWIFHETPSAPITITYNQTGKTRLKLGSFALDEDTEYIEPEAISELGAVFGWPVVVGDTLTVYPDADAESTSVDGLAYHGEDNKSWDYLHDGDGTTGNSTWPQSIIGQVELDAGGGLFNNIMRSFYLFDTSALPDTANISAATFSVYGYSKYDAASIAPSLAVYSSNPASDTDIVADDFNSAGDTKLSSDVTYAAFDDTDYNHFNLNASGLALIEVDGITKFSLRESAYDGPDNEPFNGGGSDDACGFRGYYSEQGAGYKPKLVITYTTDASATVTTGTATAVTYNSVQGNGTITDAGSGTPSERGFAYTTSGTPTTADDTVSEAWASGTGAYSLPISGLAGHTTYNYRAYAITSSGTAYGAVVQFTTLHSPPTVVTGTASSVTAGGFTMGGTITDAGSGTPSERGFAYNTSGTPTVADDTVSEAWASGTGAYSLAISGSASTTYYVRAYALITSGTIAYGSVVDVTTLAAESGTCCAANTAAISALEDAVDAMEADIRGLETSVANLETDVDDFMEDFDMVAEVLLVAILVVMAFWRRDLLLYFAGAASTGLFSVVWWGDYGMSWGFPTLLLSVVLLWKALKQLWEARPIF